MRVPRNVQSIERAAAILRILASGDRPRPLGVLAELVGLRKSTARGIVRTLTSVGFRAPGPRLRGLRPVP
ncbi:helix-turn-helix domain-containing protein [Leekyejoonella antrihumi]|uniref:helix-turn-helix domain-containing protein n=1 Tax=Leekyejoonella antrihumi TaxID=1660198 RepID=UPI003CCC5736